MAFYLSYSIIRLDFIFLFLYLISLIKYILIIQINYIDVAFYSNNFNIYDVIFVTSFFPLKTSKHPIEEYFQWSSRLLNNFEGEMYVFTTNEIYYKFFQKYNKKRIHFLYNYKSIFDINCVKGLENTYENQVFQDPEYPRINHSSYLYAIWNSKICLINVIAKMHRNSYIFWLDIGTFREDYTRNITFYSNAKMYNFLKKSNYADAIFCSIEILTQRIRNKKDYIIGGFFGIKSIKTIELYNGFWEIHNKMLENNEFVGKDQTIYNKMILSKNYNIEILKLSKYNNNCNPWFIYLSLLSTRNPCNFYPEFYKIQ